MNNKLVKYRKRLRLGVLCMAFVLVTSACSLSPSGDNAAVSDENQSAATATETQVPMPKDSPTITLIPTETVIPTETLSPTPRPTWTPFPTKTLRPTWTPSPTISPTATSEVGPVLKEDFSDTAAPWLKKEGANWATGIARGAYFMSISEKNVEITSSQSWLKLADVRIEADVYWQNGKGYFGFSCRESEGGSYYTLFITSDGHYGLGETRNEKVEFMFDQFSDVILTGRREVNHIRGDCRGDTLTLYVNGNLLIRKTVTDIGAGYVGMMAGTQYENENITVFFDNLEIWGPIE